MDEEKIIIDVVVDENGEAQSAVDDLIASTLGLTKATHDLSQERKSLDTTTKDGLKRQIEIDGQLKKHNETIKQNTSTLQAGKKGYAEYAQGLSAISPGLSSTITGISGMTKASLAFIATPIGAILAALVGVFALLKVAIGASEENMDTFEDITSIVSAVFEVFTRRVGLLVEALVAFVRGDFGTAFEKFGDAVSGIGDELSNNINKTLELNKATRELEDAYHQLNIMVSETDIIIAELMLKSKNRTLEEKDRAEFVQKALEKENQQIGQRLIIMNEELRIAAETIGKEKNLFKQREESTVEYSKRLIESDAISEKNKQKLDEGIVKINQAILSTVTFQEKANNQLDKLEEARTAKIEKEIEARLKAEEEYWKDLSDIQKDQDKVDKENEKVELEKYKDFKLAKKIMDDIEFEQKQNAIKAEFAFLDQMKADGLKADEAVAKKQIELDKFKNQAIIGGVNLVTKEKSLARIALNTIFKADALRETAINGYNAAVAAYKSLAGIPYIGPILGAAAAVAVGIFTASQLANIAGITFAKGGQVNKRGTFGGSYHSEGGNKYIDMRSGHTIEVEKDENFYVLNRAASAEINALSGVNVKHGGRSFGNYTHYAALGGQINTQSVGRTSISQAEINSIVTNTLRNVRVVAYIEDIRRAGDKQIEIESNAQVI